MAEKSDSLKGTIKDWKRNHRGVFATGGPWRLPDVHVADAHGGKVPAGKGDVVRNMKSADHVRTKHQRKSSPMSTHIADSAVLMPKRGASPVAGKKKRGVQR